MRWWPYTNQELHPHLHCCRCCHRCCRCRNARFMTNSCTSVLRLKFLHPQTWRAEDLERRLYTYWHTWSVITNAGSVRICFHSLAKFWWYLNWNGLPNAEFTDYERVLLSKPIWVVKVSWKIRYRHCVCADLIARFPRARKTWFDEMSIRRKLRGDMKKVADVQHFFDLFDSPC